MVHSSIPRAVSLNGAFLTSFGGSARIVLLFGELLLLVTECLSEIQSFLSLSLSSSLPLTSTSSPRPPVANLALAVASALLWDYSRPLFEGILTETGKKRKEGKEIK